MLLRRITEHVKAQNWFAVGLDFMIVIVGVFIGIQVANWNETRGDRHREAQILNEVAADLRADIYGYANSLDTTLNKIAAATYIVEKSKDVVLNEVVDLLTINGLGYEDLLATSPQFRESGFTARVEAIRHELWTTAILVYNAQSSTTAFDSLVNSGELGVIQNATLVRGLQEYRFITAALEKAQDVTFRPARNTAIEIGHNYGLAAFGGVDEDALLELVAANPQLSAVLQTQLGWAKGHFIILMSANERAVSLLREIEDELGAELDRGATEPAQ